MSEQPVIALIDMDCFFVQVEQRGKPELIGKPCAVTQYNTYKGGGIIAVNYEARAFGVKRNMRGEDAVAKCKDIVLFHTPQRRGKADSSKYREASFEVFDVLTNFDSDLVIEKASIDEAYIDLSDYLNRNPDLQLPTKDEMLDCFVEGVQGDDSSALDFKEFYEMITAHPDRYPDEIRLLKGAKLVSTLREAVLEKTQFHCSAGISHSKVLAKLAAGLHKPKSQTILPNSGKKQVLARTEIQKLRSLGGKFGQQIIERLNIQFVDQINDLSIEHLRTLFGEKTTMYMIGLANGIDDEKVVARKLSKSIGCGKNFSAVGTDCLKSKEQVEHWIGQLVDELLERLDRDKELNNRRPTLLVLSMDQANLGMLSRSTQFEYFGKERLIQMLMSKILNPILFKKDNAVANPIRMLSVAATKFIELVEHKNTIEGFFQKMQSRVASDEAHNVNQLLVASTSRASEGPEQATASENQQENEAANQRSKTEFKNLNCKNRMDEYFRELEANIRPKEVPKKTLTIQNMFNKIAEQTGQDLKTRRDEQLVVNEENARSVGDLLAGNQASNSTSNSTNNPTKARPNPIIDLINKKNNQRSLGGQPVVLITLDDNQPSTSNAPQPGESFAAKQLKLIREQGLLDENELKKLEEELLGEERQRPVEKIGFFRRKTQELKGKKRKFNAIA